MRKLDKLDITAIVFFVILLNLLWYLFVPTNEDVMRVYKKQIRTAQDTSFAELYSDVYISTFVNEESQNEYTKITTNDSAEFLKLKVTYNSNDEIVKINFTCYEIWSRIVASILAIVASMFFYILGYLCIESFR